ncbi:MFS transporter [Baekduia sp. Peel2402]|uniref:MFS transporter n=1 Tax=Baekduia sp. Peel2402 TaxID=3458296 RepID=UPI00403ED064
MSDRRALRGALYAGGFIGPFGGGMVTVLIPELRNAFDVSTSAASLSLTAYLVPFAALQLVSGTLGERLGRSRATGIAFLVYAVASAAAALTTGYAAFLAARAIQGAANAFTTPLVLATLAEDTAPPDLGRTMGTFAAVQTAGIVAAPLIGGLAGALDYRLAFLAAAVAAIALAVASRPRRGVEEGVGDAAVGGATAMGGDAVAGEVAAAPAERPRFADALTRETYRTALAAFLAYLAITGVGVVVALRAGDAFGLGPTARGLLLAGFGAAGVFAGRPAGAWVDRAGARRVAVTGAIACVVTLPLLGIVDGAAGLALCWIAAGVASAFVWAGLNVFTVSAAPRNRGGAVSLIGAFKFAGNALAPVLWLPLGNAAFTAAAGVCVAMALVVARS